MFPDGVGGGSDAESALTGMNLEERLVSWGVFWRRRTERRQRSAESLEGNWRSKQPWDVPPLTAPPRCNDPADAEIIEAAVCSLPLFYHVLLKSKYVRQYNDAECVMWARKAGNLRREPTSNFPVELAMGKAKLIEQLALPVVLRKQRASEYVRRLLGLDPLTFPPIAEYPSATT